MPRTDEEEARALARIRERLGGLPNPTQLLEHLFAFSPVAFQLYDARGRCVLTNPAFVALFGAEPPPEYDVFRDEVLAERGVLDLIRRAFAGERVVVPPIWYDPRELRHVAVAEGRRIAIGAEFFPLPDRDGNVAFVAIVFRDVTQDRLRQEQVEAESRRVGFLARASRALAASLEYETTLRAVAHAAVPEFADWCLVDLVEGGALRRAELAFADPGLAAVAARVEALAIPDVAAAPLRIAPGEPAGDGPGAAARRALLDETGCASLIAVPLVAGGRTLGGLTLLRTDPARPFVEADLVMAEELAGRAALSLENARLFREARRTSASLEEAMRAKDAFLAMLGHELRNPLAPIVTALELMRLRGSEAFARERAVIQRQVEHLRRLVDDLLDVSRITRGKIALRRRVVEVAAVVADAIETVSPLLEQRAHRLVVDVPARGLAVEADPGRLGQVLTNLLSNAARYTEPGGNITVSAAAHDGMVTIAVRDDGIGIAPELLPHVFDLFTQGERAYDRSQGGLGLGLAIVRGLVELHGGTVSAAPADGGRGTEFRVRLPAATVVPAATALPPAAREERPPARRVLVVDDNADAAHGIAALLEARGHTVATAQDGPEALRVAAGLRPDVALLDLGLPVMDGYELAGRLRALPGCGAVRLVAVTGYGQPADRARSTAAGFDEYLVKPVEAMHLAAAVEDGDDAATSAS